MELIGDIGATHLGYDYFGRGIQLAEYYAEEARRIYLTAQVNQQLIDAQKLLDWIRGNWQEKNNLISLPDVYREYARSPYRDQSSARQGVDILVDHGHLVKCAPAIVNGHNRREVWTVIKS